jgi:zinc transport system substrate-binding protein
MTMSRPFTRFLAVSMSALLGLASCSGERGTEAAPAASGAIVAVNGPLETFAARLADGLVAVENPVPRGEDPQDWMPDAATIARVQQASLILLQGAGAGPWGESISLPASRTIDTTANARSRFPEGLAGMRHAHGGGAEHVHGATAAQAWLDLGIARLQARAVRDAIVRLDPEAEAEIDARWRSLDAELAALHEQFREALRDAPPLLASHPVYPFLANAYGLSIESVHWEPEDEPDDAAFAELASLQAKQGATLMLWEGEPTPATRAKLEAMGLRVVVFEPGGTADGERDFIESMEDNLNRLREALAASPSATPETPTG